MSYIKRLSIRGLRNVSEEDERSIKLSCPVTLILGENGTGKTTFIESLKYVTTGEYPPGTDKGKSFVHDPVLAPRHTNVLFLQQDVKKWTTDKNYMRLQKLISNLRVVNDISERGVALITQYNNLLTKNEKQQQALFLAVSKQRKMIRAQAKAEITDKRGEPFFICRSLEAIRKQGGNITIKSIDNVIAREDKTTKKKVAISNRCADTNNQISDFMGVSKSILNYVIFCHQDDSYWPMEGGKELKTRLDEIFGTLKYNKALETVRKTAKTFQSELKLLAVQKDGMSMLMNEVKAKKIKLNDDKARGQELLSKIEVLENELAKIANDLKEICEKEKEYNKKLMEQNKKKMDLEHCQKEINMLKSNIEEIYAGSDEQLAEEINSYEKKVDERSEIISKLEGELEKGLQKEKYLVDSLAQQRGAIGKLEQQLQDHKRRVQQRNNILSKALEAWNIDSPSSVWSEHDATELMKMLSSKYNEFEKSVEKMRMEREKLEKEMQNKIDSIRTKRSAIESEMTLKDSESEKIRKEKKHISDEIMQIGTAANRLNELEAAHQEASKSFDESVRSVEIEDVNRQLEKNLEKQKGVENDLTKIDEEISTLHRHSSLQSELEFVQSNLKSKEDELKKIRTKHESHLKKLLDTNEIPLKKLRGTLEEVQKKLIAEKEQLSKTAEDEVRRSTTLQTSIKHEEKDLENQIREIKAEKNKISEICSYTEYEDKLKLQQKKVSSIQDEKGMYAYERIAYKKYLETLSEANACCPVCKRGFQKKLEVEKLKKDINQEIENHPETLKSCEAKLKKEQLKYEKMMQMKPIVEKIMHFEKVGHKEKKDRLSRMKKELEDVAEKMTDLDFAMLDPNHKLDMCKSVIMDMALWDQCIDEIEKFNRKLKASHQSLNYSVASQRTMSEAQDEREKLKKSFNSYRQNIETLQSQKNEYLEVVRLAREKKMSLQEQLLQIRAKMQNAKQLKDKEKELRQKESELNDSVMELRDQLLSVDGDLNSAVTALSTIRKESHEIRVKNDQKRMEESRRQSELLSVQKEVAQFLNNKIEETLKNAEQELKKNQAILNELKNANSSLEKDLNRQKDDMNAQETRKKQLINNVILRKTQIEYKRKEREYSTLKHAIRDMKMEDLMSEKNDLLEKNNGLMEKNNKMKGTKEEMDRAIKMSENELKLEKYRDAEKNHKEKFVELEVTKETVKNLNAYAVGLDKVMTEYHKDRMATVNTIMRQMWSSVYTAHDISSIQIRTEATGNMESGRRTFNYKLVQVKDGVEMDMRGRCSAGQRVLASIIIRMALAETFCNKCGVLALDEPTTNLDEHNARNLANALTKIISSRASSQKNFQLIVISHDESFVRALAKIDYGGAYYHLRRNPSTGKTTVEPWNVHKTAEIKIEENVENTSEPTPKRRRIQEK